MPIAMMPIVLQLSIIPLNLDLADQSTYLFPRDYFNIYLARGSTGECGFNQDSHRKPPTQQMVAPSGRPLHRVLPPPDVCVLSSRGIDI